MQAPAQRVRRYGMNIDPKYIYVIWFEDGNASTENIFLRDKDNEVIITTKCLRFLMLLSKLGKQMPGLIFNVPKFILIEMYSEHIQSADSTP